MDGCIQSKVSNTDVVPMFCKDGKRSSFLYKEKMIKLTQPSKKTHFPSISSLLLVILSTYRESRALQEWNNDSMPTTLEFVCLGIAGSLVVSSRDLHNDWPSKLNETSFRWKRSKPSNPTQPNQRRNLDNLGICVERLWERIGFKQGCPGIENEKDG